MRKLLIISTTALFLFLSACGSENYSISANSVSLGAFNAATKGAVCQFEKPDGSSLGSGTTGDDGLVNVSLSEDYSGIAIITCTGGTYTDEATGSEVSPAPTLRVALNYSGQTAVIASPVSEIAYQIASANDDLANIEYYNTDIADELGLDGIDIATQLPTDLNNEAAADDAAGRFGLILAAISQYGATTSATPTATIESFVNGYTDGNLNSINIAAAINGLSSSSVGSNTGSATGTVLEIIGDDNTSIAITEITIEGATTLEVNATTQLTTTIIPTDASLPSVSWSSDDTTIATIDSAGLVSAKAEAGTVSITATANDGGGAADSHDITVEAAAVANQAPTADAGADQNVAAAATVNLSGSGTDSDGTIASYAWTQDSGTTITISNADSANASFTAPSTAGVIVLQLTVTDNDGATATDNVSITVEAVVENQAPTANAGDDQNVSAAETVNLSGSGTDNDGSIVSYAWTQESGTTLTLTDADSANASFDSSGADDAGEVLVFTLTVTDDNGATATDNVSITVAAPDVNSPPNANAGDDQSVAFSATVNLSGSGTDSDGTIASFAWTQVSGTTVNLTDANTENASFDSSGVDDAGEVLTFTLTVTDDDGATATDNISITVAADPNRLIANAGIDQSDIESDATVTLTASTTGGTGSISNYVWEQISGATFTITGANSATASFVAPRATATGTTTAVVLQLTVTDSNNATATDTITITVDAFVPVTAIIIGTQNNDGTQNTDYRIGVRNGTPITYALGTNVTITPANATKQTIAWSAFLSSSSGYSINASTGLITSNRTNPTSASDAILATIVGGKLDGTDFAQFKGLDIQDAHNGSTCNSCHNPDDGISSAGRTANEQYYDQ